MIRIEFETDGAAFRTYEGETWPAVEEIQRILTKVSEQVGEEGITAGRTVERVVQDVNGNTVGKWSLVTD